MGSSFLSQNEIENLIRRLNPDVVDTMRQEREAHRQEAHNLQEDSPPQAQEMERVEFPELQKKPSGPPRRSVGFFRDVPVKLTLELGSTTLTVREILALQKDSVIRLDKLAGENATLCVNGRPLTAGEVVVINDNFGFRVAEIGAKPETSAEKEPQ
ncbi:MAG: FliM/FliN family flagellar motor switch protein [Bacillota bacterium]|nr:FliM/FliN family flagellar motor switch protein [Bacillota bacterium]MDW7683004.1 FliM/FliN family flagellar motor switch protein [Bacillota bacterium]